MTRMKITIFATSPFGKVKNEQDETGRNGISLRNVFVGRGHFARVAETWGAHSRPWCGKSRGSVVVKPVAAVRIEELEWSSRAC